MAVALKVRTFKSIVALTQFAQLVGNNVTTIVSIQHDTTSGEWVIFYT